MSVYGYTQSMLDVGIVRPVAKILARGAKKPIPIRSKYPLTCLFHQSGYLSFYGSQWGYGISKKKTEKGGGVRATP
jgi:hypothetical protein